MEFPRKIPSLVPAPDSSVKVSDLEFPSIKTAIWSNSDQRTLALPFSKSDKYARDGQPHSILAVSLAGSTTTSSMELVQHS